MFSLSFQLYSAKATFFARKFEAIVSQEILNSVDSHLGITHPGRYQALSVTSHINYIAAHCLTNIVYLTACSFIKS